MSNDIAHCFISAWQHGDMIRTLCTLDSAVTFVFDANTPTTKQAYGVHIDTMQNTHTRYLVSYTEDTWYLVLYLEDTTYEVQLRGHCVYFSVHDVVDHKLLQNIATAVV